MEDAMPLYERIVEQCPASIVITDPHGIIQYVNPKFEALTGYTASEAIGQNPRVLKSGLQDPAVYHALWTTILAGRDWRGELGNRRKDGTFYWEYATISPLRDEHGVITHFIAVKEDITARKAVEDQLRVAKIEAEAANRAKSLFLASMSHELRTPLNVITGLSATLCKESHDAELTRSLNLIGDSSHHLLGIIEEILDYSGLHAGQLRLSAEPFSLRAALDTVQAIAQDAAARKQLRFSSDIRGHFPDWLLGDARRLRQLLLNLLLNAIKFTATGRVHLRLTGLPRQDGHVNLVATVFDSGIGIAPQAIPTLFEPFRQAEASTQVRYGGSGLGLSIARSFARAMHGDIRVRSILGIGSAFRASIILPSAPTSASPASPAVGSELPPLPALSILAADDIATNREVLQIMLRSLGYSVDLVEDGEAAVRAALARPYDLILLDIQMPGIDGFEAARLIRQNPHGAPRLVALTADLTRGQSDICTAAGLDGVLTKPTTPQELASLIRRLFPANVRQKLTPLRAPLPLIDENHLAAFTEGLDPELQQRTLASLWHLVGQDLDQHLPLIEQALRSQDADALASAAHTIKGTLATAGWARAAGLAKELLELARAGQLAHALTTWSDLQCGIEETRAFARLRFPASNPN